MKRITADVDQIIRDGAWGRLQGLRHGVQLLLSELNEIHSLFGIPHWKIAEPEKSEEVAEDTTMSAIIAPSGQTRRTFTDAFKAKAVAAAQREGISPVARRHNIGYAVIKGWVKQSRVETPQKRPVTKSMKQAMRKQALNMREKLARMQREYKRLGGTGPVSRAKLDALKAQQTT